MRNTKGLHQLICQKRRSGKKNESKLQFSFLDVVALLSDSGAIKNFSYTLCLNATNPVGVYMWSKLLSSSTPQHGTDQPWKDVYEEKNHLMFSHLFGLKTDSKILGPDSESEALKNHADIESCNDAIWHVYTCLQRKVYFYICKCSGDIIVCALNVVVMNFFARRKTRFWKAMP